MIVWLSYDRWLAVCKPQIFPTKQTLEVVHWRFAVTIIITFLVYVPSPFRLTYCCTQMQLSNEGMKCCVQESSLMNESWFYTYEFIREIYSRFLPGILITAFNGSIIYRLFRRGRRFYQRRGGSPCSRDPPSAISALSAENTAGAEEVSSKEVCRTIQYPNLNCCLDIPTSPGPAEKVELQLVSEINGDANRKSSSENGIKFASKACKVIKMAPSMLRKPNLTPSSSDAEDKNQNPLGRARLRVRYIFTSDSKTDREVCLVFLLLAITLFFYISSFPSALYKIMPVNVSSEEEKVYDVFRAVADVLEVSGHVFNFCLYFLLSPDFRRTLLSLLPCLCRSASSSQII